MATYRDISEIDAALADRARAQGVMARVNKGGKGSFDYIPWNESARLLSDIFGVFGWETRKVSSVDDIEHGIYIYDLELSVYVADAEGQTHRKVLTGRGVGVVSQSQLQNGEAHDTAAKAARSDALSVACKSLGDAFGLFLYDKGDPARGGGTPNGYQARTEANASAPSAPVSGVWARQGDNPSHPTMQPEMDDLMSRAPQPAKKLEWIGNFSIPQVGKAKAAGWSTDQLVRLTQDEARRVMDGLFGKEGAKPVPVPGKAPVTVPPTEVLELERDAEAQLPF